MTIGERLRQWREDRGLSQREAAAMLGVTQPAWCSYERDESTPRADAIQGLISLTADDPACAVTLEMFASADRARRSTGTDG